MKLLDMLKKYQRMRAYSLYVTHMLDTRYAYALYAKGTLRIRYTTLSIRYLYVCRGLWSVGGV